MTWYRLVHEPTGEAVAVVERAQTWRAKGWGALGKRALPPGEGLWLPGVASVHTLFMRVSLDLLFLDAGFQAVRLMRGIPPGRWPARAAGACHTLELGMGTLSRAMQSGDKWRLEPIGVPSVITKKGTG